MNKDLLQRALDRMRARTAVDLLTGCHIYKGPTRGSGYGGVYVAELGQIYTHRLAFVQAKGDIPPGMQVCHTCDVRTCVNPDHLFLGSQGDNMRDMTAKDRHPRAGRGYPGERNGAAKLTTEDVLAIRAAYAAGSTTHSDLAEQFGLARGTVTKILNRALWSHV